MRVLVVDDDPLAVEMLEHALRQSGYEVTVATNGREALQLVRTAAFRMVVSDVDMPEMSGIELCQEIRSRGSMGYIYVVLLTGHIDPQSVVDGLNAGADDYICKPFQPAELELRLRAGQRLLNLESHELTIFSLAKLAESRDSETGDHLERMREYCRILAEELATWEKYRDVVDGNYVQLIYTTSPLHDIGKVGIPDAVLCKPGRLTAEEFEIMKAHTVIGSETLEAAVKAYPEAKFLQMAQAIALTHHEKWNGTGYPAGLGGEQIPLCGRIVAVADVYDALTSKRVYKPAFSHEVACQIILEGEGEHFDPDLVQAFRNAEPRILEVRERLGEPYEAELPVEAL